MPSEWCRDVDLDPVLDRALVRAREEYGERLGKRRADVSARYLLDTVRVTAIAPGMRREKGVLLADAPCVTFYVPRKMGTGRNRAAWRGAREDLIPAAIDLGHGEKIPTDIVEGAFRAIGAEVSRQGWVSPARPGCSISGDLGEGANLTAGTLGAILKDAANRTYVLSCNHILAFEGKARLGSPIHQPGLADCDKRDSMARLTAFVDLKPKGTRNLVDAAMAEVDGREVEGGFIEVEGAKIPRLADSEPLAPKDGMEVFKVGRTTGYTEGVIHSSTAVAAVDEYMQGTLDFEQQIIVRPMNFMDVHARFAHDGDSGALVAEKHSGRPVGMVIGAGGSAVVNWISRVLSELEAVSGLRGLRIVAAQGIS